MALNGRVRIIRRVTGVAVTAAPKVRRLAADDRLRTDVSRITRSAGDIVREVSADERVRQDLRDMITSALDGAARVRQDVRPRRRGMRLFAFATVFVLTACAIAVTLAYPRSRRGLVRVADGTRQRASATVHDARERFGGRGARAERWAA